MFGRLLVQRGLLRLVGLSSPPHARVSSSQTIVVSVDTCVLILNMYLLIMAWTAGWAATWWSCLTSTCCST